jgi:hypothetical protein
MCDARLRVADQGERGAVCTMTMSICGAVRCGGDRGACGGGGVVVVVVARCLQLEAEGVVCKLHPFKQRTGVVEAFGELGAPLGVRGEVAAHKGDRCLVEAQREADRALVGRALYQPRRQQLLTATHDARSDTHLA